MYMYSEREHHLHLNLHHHLPPTHHSPPLSHPDGRQGEIQQAMVTPGGDVLSLLSTRQATARLPKSQVDSTVKVPLVGRPSKAAPSSHPPPPHHPSIRVKDQILADTSNYKVEKYAGLPTSSWTTTRDDEKRKLALTFEMGRERAGKVLSQQMMVTHASRAARSGPDASASGGGGVDREAEELRERKEAMLDLIVDEVRERREFLEEMQAAGKGHAYEHVRQEMKSRLVELERLSQT